jgi:hypothetical protein
MSIIRHYSEEDKSQLCKNREREREREREKERVPDVHVRVIDE